MMKKRAAALFFAVLASVFSLFSCAKKDGREKLCEFLFSGGYEAEFDFSLSGGENEISGSATVKKDEKVRLQFASPDPFSSLSVESDELGEPGVLIFNYYGMRAPLPDKAMGKISLLLSLFDDEMPKAIRSSRTAVEKYSDGKGTDALMLCGFVRADGAECRVIYDKTSGFPQKIYAKLGEICAEVTFTKITPPLRENEAGDQE